MSLVQYSDSEPDDADVQPSMPRPAVKRKRSSESGQASFSLPPLPAAFHDLYSANARVSTTDDPSLHGGRKRAVPHIEGHWPSHVYLEWVPSQAEFQKLNNLIDHVRDVIALANSGRQKPLPVPEINSSLLSELGTPVPLHISLSRTLQIKTDERESFLETLTSRVRGAAVRPFNGRFTGLKWVPNYERNRWFLVLGIEKPARDELNRVLDACNDAAAKCGHPPLYVGGKGDGPMEDHTTDSSAKRRRKSAQSEDTATKVTPSGDRSENLHVSIAWNLAQPDPGWIALVQSISVNEYIASPQAPFEVVKVKMGNIVNTIDLDSRTHSLGKRGGLLGVK